MPSANTPISMSDLIEAFGDRLRTSGSAQALEKAGSALMVSEMVTSALAIAREHCCESLVLRHARDEMDDPDTSTLELVLVWPEGRWSETGGFEPAKQQSTPPPHYPDDWRECVEDAVLAGTAAWAARCAAREEYCEGVGIDDAVGGWEGEWATPRMASASRHAFGVKRDEMVVSFDCAMSQEEVDRRTLSPDILAGIAASRIAQSGQARGRPRKMG